MKYKVKGTDIRHNGTLYPEGSEIELADKDAKALSGLLEPVQEEKKITAEEKIAMIKAAASIEEVRELLKGESRVTVVDAGKEKIKELKKGGNE